MHVHAALNVGANRQEVVEAIMHMLPNAGLVSVQQAMTLAAEVLPSAAGPPDRANSTTDEMRVLPNYPGWAFS